jgi:hypothetical protein
MLGLNATELSLFKKLNNPIKIQDFLDTMPIHWEKNGPICLSPREALKTNKAHCLEGALLAAAILWIHGKIPWIMDLKTSEGDDHVVALYKINGYWGAISKTNHPTLRFRDPIYGTIHELALSYFHEYFKNTSGTKILESYSKPFNLKKYGYDWIISGESLDYIGEDLDNHAHYELIPPENRKYIRKADKMEMRSGNIIEWKRSNPRT